jgi:hypothetical protein
MATIIVEQLPASYEIKFNYLDDTQPGLDLKVEILDEGNNIVYTNDPLSQDTDYTYDLEQAGSYSVKFYLWILGDWNLEFTEAIDVLEWQMIINWTYSTGTGNNSQVNAETNYYYSPSSLLLNSQACQVPQIYQPEITYYVYYLVNGVWTPTEYSDYYDLNSWDDNTSSVNDIKVTYQSQGYPIKIITTISNCNQIVTYDTYIDGGQLITTLGEVNLHYETQIGGSYTMQFSYLFQDPFYPNLIITPENNAQCNIFLYKNNQIIHVYEGLEPEQNFTYTFDEASKEGVAEYKVRYRSLNPDFPQQVVDQDVIFTVGEYKPTFEVPAISCKQIGEYANIVLNQLNFNCYSEDSQLHILNPDPLFTPNIRYTLYYFNKDTYLWEQESQVDTPNLDSDAIAYYNDNPEDLDFDISQYLQNKYYYGSDDTELWSPNKLTMVKLVVAVTNYSTTVTKEVIFPICGSWKLRRMSCGNYRLYNYTADTGFYPFIDLKTNTVLKTIEVPPFSFTNFTIDNDGVYKITGQGTTRYIFNFCSIEGCVLELQKKVLLDDTLCDACKLDKVLYQKALRLIPIYETWKKLLDKDWVYEIQYQTTDIDGSLAAIYDADELYAELKLLCEECTNDSKSKKCNC